VNAPPATVPAPDPIRTNLEQMEGDEDDDDEEDDDDNELDEELSLLEDVANFEFIPGGEFAIGRLLLSFASRVLSTHYFLLSLGLKITTLLCRYETDNKPLSPPSPQKPNASSNDESGAIPLPDIREARKKKQMEEELARQEEELEEKRVRIKRSDKEAFTRVRRM